MIRAEARCWPGSKDDQPAGASVVYLRGRGPRRHTHSREVPRHLILGQRAHTRWATVVCSDDHLPTDAGDCESISGWVANGSDSENTEGVEKFRDIAFGV